MTRRPTNVVRRHVAHASRSNRASLRRGTVETRALFNFGSNNAQTNQGPSRADYDEQEVRCVVQVCPGGDTCRSPPCVRSCPPFPPASRRVRGCFFFVSIVGRVFAGLLRPSSAAEPSVPPDTRPILTDMCRPPFLRQVEDYFNYMGMLASDGNYDRLDEYNSSGLDCVDLLLLMAASEGDTPKVEELLEAGADVSARSDKVYGGKTAMELCTKDDIKQMLQAKM